jgi:hypothetical protein
MYRGGSTKCEDCEKVLDTQTHATECPERLNFEMDCDLVTFFRRILERERTEKDDGVGKTRQVVGVMHCNELVCYQFELWNINLKYCLRILIVLNP